MTDHHKQLSLADLDLPRKRGRPSTGKALSPAQKQKVYRDRLKQSGKKSVLLDADECRLIRLLITEFAFTPGFVCDHETYLKIRDKLEPQ